MAGVFGIGAGPGDPGLLTLRAADVLGRASLVMAPKARSDAESVALRIVASHLRPECRVVEAVFPMSEDTAERDAAAAAAATELALEAGAGGTAVFVTLGDAMLYSTWGYVLRALRRAHANVPVETVPGVTAMAAAAAALGEPLAEGADPLLVWPAEVPADLAPLLDLAPNIVAMKAGRRLAAVVDAADAAGASVSGARRVGMDGERVAADARDLLGEQPDYFTLAIVRKGAPDAQ